MRVLDTNVGAAALLLLLGSFAGCSCDDEDSGKSTACTPGEADCTCADGDSCDDGLACERNLCVPDTCPRGTEDCACLTDGTCNAGAGGATLTCTNNVCDANGGPAEGSAGGPCYANDTCDGGLECTNGICEDPSCPSATLGCPCGPGGACSDAGATCNADNTCANAGCTAGSLDCDCGSGDTCDDGLMCDTGLCRSPNRLRGTIGDTSVRACDVLLAETSRKVLSVTFDGAVTGEFLRQEPRVGLSFFSRNNETISGAFTVVLDGEAPVSDTDVSVAQVNCYDSTGAVVASPNVQIGQ